MKRKRSGTFMIIMGLVLIAVALSLFGYDAWLSRQAANASADAEKKLVIPKSTDDDPYLDPDAEMPVETVDGYEYIGILEIPALNMKLPVMKDWSYPKLKISPCRYTGSYFKDDMVICAHNSRAHFMPLWNIAVGTDVYFTNVKGMRLHYLVSNLEYLSPFDVEQMTENKNNSEDSQAEWDLTLYTCTYGSRQRLAVRCVRVRKNN